MVPTYRPLEETLLVGTHVLDSSDSARASERKKKRAATATSSSRPAHTSALRLVKTMAASFADFRLARPRWSVSVPAFAAYEPQRMVLSADQLHVEFREQYIFEGYRRPTHSYCESLVSLFRLDNNETINFWTHFLPFLYTMYRLVQLFFIYDVRNDERIWPMIVYLLTANLYLAASSLAHAVNCTGLVAHHICFIVDYLGISIYGVGSAIAYRAYTFTTIDPSDLKTTDAFDSYTNWVMLIAVSTNTMSSASRFIISKGARSFFRIFPFFLQYIYVATPIFYRLGVHSSQYSLQAVKDFLFHGNGSSLVSNDAHFSHRIEADFYYVLKFMAALVSSLLYGLRIPERIYPRRFDIVGQSHQIFHLTTFTCTLFQLIAVEMDFTKTLELTSDSSTLHLDKRIFTHANVPLTDAQTSHTVTMLVCLALNAAIVYYFYVKTLTDNPWRKASSFMTFTSCCSRDYCDSCYACCQCSCDCHLSNRGRYAATTTSGKVRFETDEPGDKKLD